MNDLWYPTLLPFIGFRTLSIGKDGKPSRYRTHLKASCFLVEWFECGAVFYVSEVIADD